MFLALFCTDFQQSLKNLIKETEKNAFSSSAINRRKLETQFCQLIQFHADIRQLSAIIVIQSRIQDDNLLVISLHFKRLAILSSSIFMNVVSILFLNMTTVLCVGLLGAHVVR